MSLNLLENVATNTDGPFIESNGFQGALVIFGDIGGGTVTIETSADAGVTPLTIKDQSQAAINVFDQTNSFISQFAIPKGIFVRARLTGATSPNLTVRLV